MNSARLEKWAPWALLAVVIALWQFICFAFNVSEFIFPSPLRIASQMLEFRGTIAHHAWTTFWVTMVGFAIAIVVLHLAALHIGSPVALSLALATCVSWNLGLWLFGRSRRPALRSS